MAAQKYSRIYYVVARDGEGNVVEIITKEEVRGTPAQRVPEASDDRPNAVGEDGPKVGIASGVNGSSKLDQAIVYTVVDVKDDKHKGIKSDDKIIPEKSSSPARLLLGCPSANVANNGESYGRGRVEEYRDLTSLEGLAKHS